MNTMTYLALLLIAGCFALSNVEATFSGSLVQGKGLELCLQLVFVFVIFLSWAMGTTFLYLSLKVVFFFKILRGNSAVKCGHFGDRKCRQAIGHLHPRPVLVSNNFAATRNWDRSITLFTPKPSLFTLRSTFYSKRSLFTLNDRFSL